MSLIGRLVGGETRSVDETSYINRVMNSAFGDGPSYTGRFISQSGSLKLPAVYSCVRILSNSVGTLPLHIYKSGSQKRLEGTPLVELLNSEANPNHTSVKLWKLVMVHLNLDGNAYLWKERDNFGKVIALWPIVPNRVSVGVDDNGLKVFKIQNPMAGNYAVATSRDLMHFMGMSADGITGLSPIEQARQALGIYSAHEEYQGRFYANNAQPGGIIQLKDGRRLDAEGVKDLKANWNAAYGGLHSAGKVGVLDDGSTFTQLSMSLADQQFIDQQHFSISQVCNIFGVPQYKLGEATGDSLTYSTTEQQQLNFVTDTVRPWCIDLESTLKADGDLFVDRSLYPKFNMDAIQRADLKTRYEAHGIAIDKGFKGRDEVRASEDLDPIPEEYGVPQFGPLASTSPETPTAQDKPVDRNGNG